MNERINKLPELEKSFKLINEETFTQGVRIKNIDKMVNDGFHKYDRIYLDNLCIPGLIGEYCKFKNFKDFIENCQNQLQSLTNFGDKHTLDLKSYKDKLDGLISQFDLQVKQAERSNKDYTNLKIESIEKTILTDRANLENKIDENRLMNYKYSKDLLLATESIKIDKENLTNFKFEIRNKIEEGYEKMKEQNRQTTESFDSVKVDFDVFKKKFNEIVEFIKDIRFRRNLGAEVKKKETNELSSKIEFNKMRRSLSENKTNNKIEEDDYFSEGSNPFNEEKNIKEEIKLPAKSVKIKKPEAESYVKNYINGKGGFVSKKKNQEVNRKLDPIDLKINKIIGSIEEEQFDDTISDDRMYENSNNDSFKKNYFLYDKNTLKNTIKVKSGILVNESPYKEMSNNNPLSEDLNSILNQSKLRQEIEFLKIKYKELANLIKKEEVNSNTGDLPKLISKTPKINMKVSGNLPTTNINLNDKDSIDRKTDQPLSSSKPILNPISSRTANNYFSGIKQDLSTTNFPIEDIQNKERERNSFYDQENPNKIGGITSSRGSKF